MSTDTPRTDAATDADLRQLWRDAGGHFHGPRVEHATISEARLFDLLRDLTAAREQIAAMTEERDGARKSADIAIGYLKDIGDWAHGRSTGPTAPDDLWEVRRMAYEGMDAAAIRRGEGQ